MLIEEVYPDDRRLELRDRLIDDYEWYLKRLRTWYSVDFSADHPRSTHVKLVPDLNLAAEMMTQRDRENLRELVRGLRPEDCSAFPLFASFDELVGCGDFSADEYWIIVQSVSMEPGTGVTLNRIQLSALEAMELLAMLRSYLSLKEDYRC